MPELMVFVPSTRRRAAALRDGGPAAPLVGHAATPGLLRAHGLDSSLVEDGEFAALGYAAVRAALEPGADKLRLVLAADVPTAGVEVDAENPYGLVSVRGLRWSMVRALFADESVAAPTVAAASAAAAGRTLDEALALPEVERLSDDHDLLWFNPDELDRLPGAPGQHGWLSLSR